MYSYVILYFITIVHIRPLQEASVSVWWLRGARRNTENSLKCPNSVFQDYLIPKIQISKILLKSSHQYWALRELHRVVEPATEMGT